jgi:hypothetical protein
MSFNEETSLEDEDELHDELSCRSKGWNSSAGAK